MKNGRLHKILDWILETIGQLLIIVSKLCDLLSWYILDDASKLFPSRNLIPFIIFLLFQLDYYRPRELD